MTVPLIAIESSTLVKIVGFGTLAFIALIVTSVLKRYKRCPSDRLMVVYGKFPDNKGFRVMHRKSAFIWPNVQDYDFLDLTPLTSRQQFTYFDVTGDQREAQLSVTFAVSTNPELSRLAATRLYSLGQQEIYDIVTGMLKSQITEWVSQQRSIKNGISNEDPKTDFEKRLKPLMNQFGIELIGLNFTDNSIFR